MQTVIRSLMTARMEAVRERARRWRLRVSTEPPTVDHETFEAIKPGLSAYADDPEKVRRVSLMLVQMMITLRFE